MRYITVIIEEIEFTSRLSYSRARSDPCPTAYVVLTRNRVVRRENSHAKLTKRVVDAAESRERDYVIWDDELPGFSLCVFASGSVARRLPAVREAWPPIVSLPLASRACLQSVGEMAGCSGHEQSGLVVSRHFVLISLCVRRAA
jgi:hypothetical protein